MGDHWQIHVADTLRWLTEYDGEPVVPEGIVLDPFTGSASIGEAVLLEGRRYVGLELIEPIAEAARRRLEGVETCRTHDEVATGQGGLFA